MAIGFSGRTIIVTSWWVTGYRLSAIGLSSPLPSSRFFSTSRLTVLRLLRPISRVPVSANRGAAYPAVGALCAHHDSRRDASLLACGDADRRAGHGPRRRPATRRAGLVHPRWR